MKIDKNASDNSDFSEALRVLGGPVYFNNTLSVDGVTTLNNTLNLNASTLATNQTTFNLLNTNATTINFGGAGTTVMKHITANAGNILQNNASSLLSTLCKDTNTINGDASYFQCYAKQAIIRGLNSGVYCQIGSNFYNLCRSNYDNSNYTRQPTTTGAIASGTGVDGNDGTGNYIKYDHSATAHTKCIIYPAWGIKAYTSTNYTGLVLSYLNTFNYNVVVEPTNTAILSYKIYFKVDGTTVTEITQ